MTEMNNDIAERVCKVIAKHMRIPPENVTTESTFADLGIDSLDGVNLLFEIEDEFDINIEDDQARSIRSVPDMVEGIQRLLAEKAAKTGNIAPSSQAS
jgi:acyl carrier protein